MTVVASKPIPAVPLRKYRASLFLAWLVFVFWRQHRDYIRNRSKTLPRSNVKSEEPSTEETVKVHGVNIRFTQTKGGFIQFGLLNSLEFWIPVLMRSLDVIFLKIYGRDLYRSFPAHGQILQLFFAVFCIIPLAELAFPEDWSNPTKDQQKKEKKHDIIYKLPLFMWSALEIFTTITSLNLACGENASRLSLKNRLFILFTCGFFNGAIGITAAHEMIHKNKLLDKLVGYLLLCNVNYMHWGEEHLIGHHDKVATPEDPATSRLNESFYSFFPRTLFGSFKSSVEIEKKRLEEKDLKQGAQKSRFPWWFRYDNRMIYNIVLPFVWAKILSKIIGGGWKTIGAFYLQGFGAASMLEVINYVEHYGLKREKLEDGKYEPVDPTHSWNSPHRVSNAFLFKLQRHSDHHTYAMRPYQLLRNFKESPQLPTGYPGMYILAFFPPVFFWVMNPLVKAHSENKERLLKLMTDENADYSYSKSMELKKAESIARQRLAIFLSTIGGSYITFLYKSGMLVL